MSANLFKNMFGNFFVKKEESDKFMQTNKSLLEKDEEDVLKLRIVRDHVSELRFENKNVREKILMFLDFELDLLELDVHKRIGKESFDKKIIKLTINTENNN